jgi:methylation protein EvaC
VIACRICSGPVDEFFDFGQQPLSDVFRLPDETEDEFFYRLAVGVCGKCAMVQLVEEVPRERMFHEDYPYRPSWSATMREHFEHTADELLAMAPTDRSPFVVEIGSNDGTMLRTVAERGVHHLGIEPSGGVARAAEQRGVQVRVAFFEEAVAKEVRADHGPADIVFSANTICHIPYLDSVFRGLDALLAPDGVFVFEDPYLGDIVARNSFDQIYDEHFYFFSATSVQAAARRFGLELVDVRRLPVHGGEVRYTLARGGRRAPSPAVAALVAEEHTRGLVEHATLDRWATQVKHNCDELVALLHSLRAQGHSVVGYGATAKSATVTNYAGIGPDLVSYVCDVTPEKQGRLTPGTHIPVRPAEAFRDPYPDYALLFAWNHAEEIIAKEEGFRQAGGRWILYVPEMHII